MTGLEMVDREYIAPKNPFSLYLKTEFDKANVSKNEISKLFPSVTGGITGCVSNWLLGNTIITKEKYETLQKIGICKKPYEDLRKEYEDLRKEYEGLRRTWNNEKQAFDVLDFGICQDNNRTHETQKPLNLIEYLLSRSTIKNNVVLDPFMGSGTTLVACHKLEMQGIGIEKDEKYFNIAC